MSEIVQRCACGAERAAVEITSYGDTSPRYVPGPLLEPCTCPTCAHCQSSLDEGDRCPTLSCPLYGIMVPLPLSQAHEPASQDEHGA